ncbi:hypothetical protein [Bosea sp. 685]|uniref:hypothetical protein n=1 Tax=Bosea sp. 685 TaxID=3080057 RepID=UPI002893417D|nr:hypothetical protein [Bosea sp. 685]WNJ93031.1 hypothetical protein RMR04_12375 [Bosea sp. 685]
MFAEPRPVERRRRLEDRVVTTESDIMAFLDERVFNPVLASPTASAELKAGVRLTRMRLNERDAKGMVHYFWSAIVGTERSRGFAARMRNEGFNRFEEAIDEFRERFDKPKTIKTSR